MPVPIFSGITNPNLSQANLSPWMGWDHSKNGSLKQAAAGEVTDSAAPPGLPARMRLATNDNRVAGDYYVNTFDTPDTLTARSQVTSPRTVTRNGVSVPMCWLNLERYIVMRFIHDFPRTSTPTGVPSGYDANAQPFANFFTTYGKPYGGSSGAAIGIENDPDGVNVRFKGLSGWRAVSPKRQLTTLIVRRKWNSAVGAVNGWDEYWYAVGSNPLVKQTFINGTQRSDLVAFIRAGVNDDATSKNEIHVSNYHRAYMPTWDGIHYIEFTDFKVYDAADVQNVADIAPYSSPVSTPAPVANFTFAPQTPVVGQAVVLDGRSSTPATGLTYDWTVT